MRPHSVASHHTTTSATNNVSGGKIHWSSGFPVVAAEGGDDFPLGKSWLLW